MSLNESFILQDQIQTYLNSELPVFKTLARLLEIFLERHCALIAPLAIVKARTKDPASFAEKCLRKKRIYHDPVYQMTDLCGARVITSTQEDADNVCEFVRRNFLVIEEENLLKRLDINEFSYRSVHFLVTLPEINPSLCDTGDSFYSQEETQLYNCVINATDRDGKPRKRVAEIQVRTFLQHAWADIVHDRLYKTRIKLPRQYKRDAARLAAILENADAAFGELIDKIDGFEMNYGAYMNRSEMETEVAILRQLINSDSMGGGERPVHALRLALLARAMGNWEEIIGVLSPYIERESEQLTEIRVILGNAYCQCYSATPLSPEFGRGRALLHAVTEQLGAGEGKGKHTRLRAQAHAYLARSYGMSREEGWKGKALSHYYKAYTLVPYSPYHLEGYIEAELCAGGNSSFIAPLQPLIGASIGKCREHVSLHIELPFAWFTTAKLTIFQTLTTSGDHERKFSDCIDAFIRGIKECQVSHPLIEELAYIHVLRTELRETAQTEEIRQLSAGLAIVERLLYAGLTARHADLEQCYLSKNETFENAMDELMDKKKIGIVSPVVLIAGYAESGPDDPSAIDNYRDMIDSCLAAFTGTVICGGTTSGISGLVGEIACKHLSMGIKQYQLIGYLPDELPCDAGRDNRYDRFRPVSGSREFSINEPLQYWIDLLAADIDPSEVRMFGFGGGKIAFLEYELAVSLGAEVALIKNSGGAAEMVYAAEQWWNPGQVVQLPADSAVALAFVLSSSRDWERSELEPAAMFIHDEYIKKQIPSYENLQPWEKLKLTYRRSCFHQAAFAETNLRLSGLDVINASTEEIPADLRIMATNEQIEQMAIREHGRWCTERLRQGWRYAAESDKAKLLHKDLVPWEELTEEIRQYDRDAVLNYPVTLLRAGLTIRSPGNKAPNHPEQYSTP